MLDLRRFILLGLSTLTLTLSAPAEPPPATAAPDQPLSAAPPSTPSGRALSRFMAMLQGNPDAMSEKDFSAEFLAAVPIAALRKTAADLKTQAGGFTLDHVEPGPAPNSLIAVLKTAKDGSPWRLRLATDEGGVVQGLFIQPAPDLAVPALASWEDLDERLAHARGKVGLAVVEFVPLQPGARKKRFVGIPGINPVHLYNADQPLAIGSAFKLYVLGALAERIRSTQLDWNTSLRIQDSLKSLPSGDLQNLPDGTEIPVLEVATKMISISDNTAADLLIHTLGRDAVETFFKDRNSHPERTLPFLTTREMFAIKLSPDTTLPERYAQADEAARRLALSPADEGAKAAGAMRSGEVIASKPSPMLAAFWKTPRQIDRIEWFATPMDLCKLLFDLRALQGEDRLTQMAQVLSKNPGIAVDRSAFPIVWFKGGSEPGVLNMTWMVERSDHHRFALTITWNDTEHAIDEPQSIGLAARALELLGKPEP